MSISPNGGSGWRPLPAASSEHAEQSSPLQTRVAGIAVSDAGEVLSQREVLERLGLTGDAFAEGIFSRCGVERRHLELGEAWLDQTTQGRAEQIERELLAHAVRAVEALAIDLRSVAAVITSSLYSMGCPTLAHRLVAHFEMAPDTDKYHVVGVGCASAVPLTRLASHVLLAESGGSALVVAADSMSGIMAKAAPGDEKAKVIGAAIFGDGCAAAALSSDPDCEGPVILASAVHQLPNTLGAVALRFTGDDGYLHLDRKLPDIAAAALPRLVDAFLERRRLSRSDIDHWIVHPGGRRIIEGIQESLGLSRDDVALSWSALAAHGNIGTPSLFYVLRDTLEKLEPAAGERGLAVTIGPGVTVGTMLLQW